MTTNTPEKIWLKFYSTSPFGIIKSELPERCKTVDELKKVVKQELGRRLEEYEVQDFSLFSPDGVKLEEDLLLNELPETSRRKPLRVVINGRFTCLTSLIEFANELKV